LKEAQMNRPKQQDKSSIIRFNKKFAPDLKHQFLICFMENSQKITAFFKTWFAGQTLNTVI